MRIVRLKKEEEINEIQLQDFFAKKVKKEEVKKYLKNNSTNKIPSHLKLIKEYDNESVLILSQEQTDLQVKVPLNQPITLEQYNKAKEIWPCKYFIEKEEEINLEYVINTFNSIIHPTQNFCSLFCLIRDEKKIYVLEKDTDNILGHSIFKSIEKVSKMKINYLCTGMDAFIYNEPCLSCCMAFVHGRIKRVFVYKQGGSKCFSELKMNYHKLTNHRYNVYFVEE